MANEKIKPHFFAARALGPRDREVFLACSVPAIEAAPFSHRESALSAAKGAARGGKFHSGWLFNPMHLYHDIEIIWHNYE
jgi:hypothetical protein